MADEDKVIPFPRRRDDGEATVAKLQAQLVALDEMSSSRLRHYGAQVYLFCRYCIADVRAAPLGSTSRTCCTPSAARHAYDRDTSC
jgi:hypothetical protein